MVHLMNDRVDDMMMMWFVVAMDGDAMCDDEEGKMKYYCRKAQQVNVIHCKMPMTVK